MPWNLLILPLIGGYYIISRSNYFKFKQQRLDRQRLIFDTVFIGIILVVITYIVRLIIGYFWPSIIDYLYNFLPFKEPFFGTSLASLLIAYICTKVGNKIFYSDRKKYIRKAIIEVGNELDLLLESSFEKSILLNITLDNNKFYIVWVKELPIPTVANYISLIPVFSGYRDEKREMIFTTHYLSVYAEYIEEGKVMGIKELPVDLIITTDNIVTVSYFDIEMYDRFQGKTGEDESS